MARPPPPPSFDHFPYQETRPLFATGWHRTAVFSPVPTHRYRLGRKMHSATLDSRLPSSEVITWVMLNPSTADAERDDPTIRRVLKFSTAWGFPNVDIGNIFALRSTDPHGLRLHEDPVGEKNDEALLAMAKGACAVVCAWGTHGGYQDRAEAVVKVLKASGMPLWTLGLTKDKHPRHPLYVSSDNLPIPFRR